MPGPVSDSYDPEFSTSANRELLYDAIREVIDDVLNKALGSASRQNIFAVIPGRDGRTKTVKITERQLRILRFAAYRAIEED